MENYMFNSPFKNRTYSHKNQIKYFELQLNIINKKIFLNCVHHNSNINETNCKL